MKGLVWKLFPSGPFTIQKPQDQETGKSESVQERQKLQNCERVIQVVDNLGSGIPDEPFPKYKAWKSNAERSWTSYIEFLNPQILRL